MAMIRSNSSRTLSQLLAVVVTVVLITVLYLAKTVILPLALAMLLTFVLAPVVTWLERARLPRTLAIATVMLAAGAILGSAGWTVFMQLVQVTDALPSYTTNIQEKIQSFQQPKTTSFNRAQRELDDLSKQISDWSSGFTTDQRHAGALDLGSPTHPVSVREVGGSQGRLDALSGVLGVVVSVILIAVFTFFMLLQREDLRNRLIRLSGQGHLHLMTQAMDDTSHRVSRYLSLQALVNMGFGLIVFVALHFIAMPHALLWGALAGASAVYPLHWRAHWRFPSHRVIFGGLQWLDEDPADHGYLLLSWRYAQRIFWSHRFTASIPGCLHLRFWWPRFSGPSYGDRSA